MTITWYVDDLMVTDENKNQIDNLFLHLKHKYKHSSMPLVVHEGKVHGCLGMTFAFLEDDKVKINMKRYIEDVLNKALPKLME